MIEYSYKAHAQTIIWDAEKGDVSDEFVEAVKILIEEELNILDIAEAIAKGLDENPDLVSQLRMILMDILQDDDEIARSQTKLN